MIKSATIYSVNPQWRLDVAKLEEALSARQFEPTGLSQEKSIGWVPPREVNGAMVESLSGHYHIMRLMVETRTVPAQAVCRELDLRIKAIEDNMGRKPGKKERRDMVEHVKLGLLPHAFPKQTAVTLWFDTHASLLVVGTTSTGRLDDVITTLFQTINDPTDKFSLQLLTTNQSPISVMSYWLQEGDTTASALVIGRECELKASDESKSVVKYGSHALDIVEVQQHIKQGKVPVKLALSYQDRISFVMTEKFQFKKIALLDVVTMEKSTKGADEFDTNFTLITSEMSTMLEALTDTLGGAMNVFCAAGDEL